VRITMNNISVHIELDIKDEPSVPIINSIKKLDCYEKEEENKTTIVSYNIPKGSVETDYTLKSFDDDMEVADALKISREDAIKFRNCRQTACHCCVHTDICNEYLYHIDRMGPAY